VAEQAVRGQRCPERQPQRQRTRRGGSQPAAGAVPQLGGGQGEHVAHRVVEGTDAGEARGERDVGHRQRAGFDQQPGGLRALRPGQRQRPGSQLGEQLPLHLAHAVAEPGGQPRDPVAVDHPVGDQPHCPRHQVGALVPLRRTGAGVRPAPLAGAEASLLGRCGAGVEPHVLRLGRHHGAAGPAVDPGADHRDEKPAVEPGVLGLHRPHPARRVLACPFFPHPNSIGPWQAQV
jgi:hypothetical protein